MLSLNNITCPKTRSCFDLAWNYILEASRDRIFLDTLRGLFPASDDYLEERQLSKLHKIVLGITSHDLSAELAISDADIDRSDSEGHTPLTWAAWRGDSKAVDIFLQVGADPNICTSIGTSALMYAVRSSLSCVKLLLEAGADPCLKDTEGYNALHCAAEHQDSKELIERLIAVGVNIHERNIFGSTPLAQAALANNVISALALLDFGADIDSKDNESDTPLHQSIRIHSDGVMQLFLNRGANYSLLNSSGSSILHLGAKSGGLRTLEILQAACLKGIDPDLADCQGKTPLQLARERAPKEEGFIQNIQILLSEIRTQNASQARPATITSDTTNEDVIVDVAEEPSQVHTSSMSKITSSGFSRWTQTSLIESATRKFGLIWITELYGDSLTRFTRSIWISFIIYWVLGLGWAGFIYLMLFQRRVGPGDQ